MVAAAGTDCPVEVKHPQGKALLLRLLSCQLRRDAVMTPLGSFALEAMLPQQHGYDQAVERIGEALYLHLRSLSCWPRPNALRGWSAWHRAGAATRLSEDGHRYACF